MVFIEIINNFKDSKEGSVFSSLPRQSFKSTVTHRDLADSGCHRAGATGSQGQDLRLPGARGRTFLLAGTRLAGQEAELRNVCLLDECMNRWVEGWFGFFQIKLFYDYTNNLFPVWEFWKNIEKFKGKGRKQQAPIFLRETAMNNLGPFLCYQLF